MAHLNKQTAKQFLLAVRAYILTEVVPGDPAAQRQISSIVQDLVQLIDNSTSDIET